MRFFLTIPIRKNSTIIFVRLVLPAYLVKKRDECGPEDKRDYNTFQLGSTVKNSGEWLCEVLLSRTTRQVSKLMLGNFFLVTIFFLCL